MNTRYQIWGVWSGVIFFVLFFLACWPLAQFIPPPSPTLSGEELVAKYQDNITLVRMAMPVGLIAAVFAIPWTAVIALQIVRIEGKVPVLGLTSLGAGIANAVAFYLVFVIWAPAFYRMDRSPELIMLINDMAWLEFVMVFPPFALQIVCIALAGFMDKSPKPIFPRWFCFLNLWVALMVVPGGLAIFFKTGPFAWNGLLAFWLPVTVFTIYFSAIIPLLLKGIKRQALEDPGQ